MFLKVAHKGKNSIGNYIATIALVIFGYFLGQIPLLIVLFQKGEQLGLTQSQMTSAIEALEFNVFGLSQNYSMFLILWTFIFAMFFLWLGVTKIHKKDFKDIITSNRKINWSKIFFSFFLWFGLTLVFEAIFYFQNPENYIFQFQPKSFLILAIIAIFLLPIQTSFEELFFRGYLLQGFSLGASERWIPLVITSIGFGLMHLMNPEIKEFGLGIMMTYYIGVGLFLGILTLLDDGLELALGVHAATNIYGATMVTFTGSAIQTPALFKMGTVDVRLMLIAFIFAAILFLVMVANKYKLHNWSKVFGNVKRADWGPFEEESILADE